jgi:hypothetical protein
VTAEIIIPLQDLVSTYTVQWWCHNHKTWTSDNWQWAHDTVRWVVLHAVHYIRKSLHLENTQESLQSKMLTLVPTMKHTGGSVMVWAAISWYSAGPIIIFHSWITAWDYADRLCNQAHPMIQPFFQTTIKCVRFQASSFQNITLTPECKHIMEVLGINA